MSKALPGTWPAKCRKRPEALAGDAKTRAEGMSQQASGMAQDAYGQARDYARDAATVISDTVEQQPIVALLVAGAIGCMIGLLLMRR